MEVYYPNGGRGVPLGNVPPAMPASGPDALFNCETLSKENWKKYMYAARFVEMVQSKTPKITLYTERGKCILMENKPEPDFEVVFYKGKFVLSCGKNIDLLLLLLFYIGELSYAILTLCKG